MLSQLGTVGPVLCFEFIAVHFPREMVETPMAKIACPEGHMDLIFQTLKIPPPVVMEKTKMGMCPFSRKRDREEHASSHQPRGAGEGTSAEEQVSSSKIRKLAEESELHLVLRDNSSKSLKTMGLKPVSNEDIASIKGIMSKTLTMKLYRRGLLELKTQSGLTINTARYVRYLKNLK